MLRPLHLLLAAIAALALIVPTLVVRHAPPPRPHAYLKKVKRPQRVVAPAETPEVDPVQFQDVSPEDAREYNASIPFSTAPNPAARPFRFAGSDDQRARATDCLAAAAYYEAGDDAVGERAVVQVVLNRLRHPAFPKTICGVVFQGQERTTGCQFTFTCDGALARMPSDLAWKRAREIAAAAMKGTVYRPVGYATHYHTDWVVPYWSASLDKIAEVHTHLFFRWTGWWGTPPAFRRAVSSDEPVVAKLAQVSDVHKLGGAMQQAEDVKALATALLADATPAAPAAPDTFAIALTGAPERFPELATKACGDRPKCKFMGWTDKAMVPATPTLSPQQMDAMSFSYLRDRETGFDRSLWNCTQFPRTGPGLCMRRQVTLRLPVLTTAPGERGPEALGGVRRKAEAGPVPVPTPVGSTMQSAREP